MPKPEKKGVEQNHYVDHIVENHILLREGIQSFGKKMETYRDTADFVKQLFPMISELEKCMANADTVSLATASDTLLMSSSDQLFSQYYDVMHKDFKVLFEVYSAAGDVLSDEEQQRVDSVWSEIVRKDEPALANFIRFAKLKPKLQKQLKPLQ